VAFEAFRDATVKDAAWVQLTFRPTSLIGWR